MTIRICLVGYGLAGEVFHAPLIAATEGLELASVISSDAGKVRADWPGMTVHAELERALDDETISAGVLACPDHLHAPLALLALERGRHVIVDKPLAPTIEEAREVAAKARECGRLLTVFHNRRWDADFLTLQQLLASGQLGEITFFESHFDRYRPEPVPSWKGRRPGGVWMDLGSHLADQALALFGLPIGVTADIATQKAGGEMPDFAHVVLRYERLRCVLNITQLACAHDLRFTVHGTGGSWIKHGLDPQEDQSKAGMAPDAPDWGVDPLQGLLTTPEEAQKVANLKGDYCAFYASWRDAVAGDGANPVPPHEALAVMAVLAAAQESARTRREVDPAGYLQDA